MTAVEVRTPRIRLVPFSPEHLTEFYLGWINDRSLMAYSEQRHRTHTLESCRVYAAQFDHEARFFWAVIDFGTGAHIGNVNAYFDRNNGVADIGLLLGSAAHRGQGYGLEAWKAAMHALFAHYGVRKVTGGCAATHRAMRNIMTKVKMQPDGVRKNQLLFDSGATDVIHMAMFSDEFRPESRFEIIQVETPDFRTHEERR